MDVSDMLSQHLEGLMFESIGAPAFALIGADKGLD
jgi:hypothetical protein